MSVVVGVLVPCRDEERVVLRKLENLASCAWPCSEDGRADGHRVVLVDDGSTDGTAARARAWAAQRRSLPFELEVVANDVAPGKAGAVRRGLAALAGVDLVVLTDADVVLHPRALGALTAAFADDPRLAIACGAQRFVHGLASDGSLRAEGLGPLVDAATFYDRATSLVRALESRVGKLVSVHGQLLAWRRAAGFEPRTGVAADDLDLLFQARRAGGRARRVRGALFVEVRTPRGRRAGEQGLRRARAWFQVFAATPWGALGAGPWDRAQELVYRFVPRFLPELLVVALASLAYGAIVGPGARPAWLVGVGGVLLLALRLPLDALVRGRRTAGEVSDRWSMPRV